MKRSPSLRVPSRGFLATAGTAAILSLAAFCPAAAKKPATPAAPAVQLDAKELGRLREALTASAAEVTDAARTVYLKHAEAQARRDADVPEAFWAWVTQFPEIKTGMLAANSPVDPGTVKNLQALRLAVGKEKAGKYRHLLLGAAVMRRRSGVEAPSNAVPSPADKEPDKHVDAIATYMKAKKVTLVHVIEKADEIFAELKLAPLKGRQRDRLWSLLAHRLGTHPPRGNPPVADFLLYLIRHHETKLPQTTKDDPTWPRFPLDTAPWPLLLPFGVTRPLRECDYIWDRFTGKETFPNGKRIMRYGRYTWDYKKPEVRWRESDWHPDSYPRILEDGGVCGRQSSFSRISMSALGQPALPMRQPGHSALIYYDVTPAGRYTAKMGQSITSPDGSWPSWYFGDARGMRRLARLGRVGAEYHQGLALAMNAGLDRYVDTRIALHLSRMLPDSDKRTAIALLTGATKTNPYNVEVWYELARLHGADLDAVNACLTAFRSVMGDPRGPMQFHQTRRADESLGEDTKTPAQNKDILALQRRWALLVADTMIRSGYARKDITDRKQVQEALAWLEKECTHQKTIRKSPYLAGMEALRDDYEIRLNGVDTVKSRVETLVLERIGRMKKFGSLPSTDIAARIGTILPHLKDREAKVAFLQKFCDAFSDRFIVQKDKKGKIKVCKVYQYLVSEQVKAVRAGRRRKDSTEAAKAITAKLDKLKEEAAKT